MFFKPTYPDTYSRSFWHSDPVRRIQPSATSLNMKTKLPKPKGRYRAKRWPGRGKEKVRGELKRVNQSRRKQEKWISLDFPGLLFLFKNFEAFWSILSNVINSELTYFLRHYRVSPKRFLATCLTSSSSTTNRSVSLADNTFQSSDAYLGQNNFHRLSANIRYISKGCHPTFWGKNKKKIVFHVSCRKPIDWF